MVLKLSNENISELTIDEIDIGLQKSFDVKITQKLINDHQPRYTMSFVK